MCWQETRWFPVPIFRVLKSSEYSFAHCCSGLLPQSTGFQSHQNSHFTSCQTTAQAGNGNLEHGICDLRCVLLPGSWKVAYPWICKRWWDITLYQLGKSGNEREIIVISFFFFWKHGSTTKLCWGFVLEWTLLFTPLAAGWAHARGLQQCYGLVAEWGQCLSDASKLNIVHKESVLLLWIQRILACKAVPEEKSPCQQDAGQSQGRWPSHVYNINKFLCDFHHHLLLFYCTELAEQNKTNRRPVKGVLIWPLCTCVNSPY